MSSLKSELCARRSFRRDDEFISFRAAGIRQALAALASAADDKARDAAVTDLIRFGATTFNLTARLEGVRTAALTRATQERLGEQQARIEREADKARDDLNRFARDFDGSEVADVDLQEAKARADALDVAAEAVTFVRDGAQRVTAVTLTDRA